jgi:hypothetical protein
MLRDDGEFDDWKSACCSRRWVSNRSEPNVKFLDYLTSTVTSRLRPGGSCVTPGNLPLRPIARG